jgi:hypothetical protein
MKLFDDIVAGLFGAVDSGGAIELDSDVPILVNSRLYTPAASSATVGMGVAGVPVSSASASAVLQGLSHSADPTTGFRTNLGAYNGNDLPQQVTFVLYEQGGSELARRTLSVPARTPVQLSNAFQALGIRRDVRDAYCTVTAEGGLPLFAYATVTDNRSQDPMFVAGVPLSNP